MTNRFAVVAVPLEKKNEISTSRERYRRILAYVLVGQVLKARTHGNSERLFPYADAAFVKESFALMQPDNISREVPVALTLTWDGNVATMNAAYPARLRQAAYFAHDKAIMLEELIVILAV